VLAATGPGLGGLPGSPHVLLTLATPRRYYQPDYYRRVAGRIYGGQARRDPDASLHGSPARFVERPTVRGCLGQLYAVVGWSSLPWLHRLRQPTLVLAGDDDPIVPLGQRTHPRPPHPRRSAAHRARWRTPLRARATGGDGRAGHPVSGRATGRPPVHRWYRATVMAWA
jgi:hypothetical protein